MNVFNRAINYMQSNQNFFDYQSKLGNKFVDVRLLIVD